MKNWNSPSINELDVRMTASQGEASTVEAPGGFANGSFYFATYDANTYERESAECFIPVKGASVS